MMEKFYIAFHMNNGDKIEIELEEDPSYEFLFVLEKTNKWFKVEDKIINLDNVNSVSIDTETKREENARKTAEALSNWNVY